MNRKSRLICCTLAVGAVAGGLALWPSRPEWGHDTLINDILAILRDDFDYGALTIDYPLEGTVFPPEIVAPTFRWTDAESGSNAWLVTAHRASWQASLSEAVTRQRSARPTTTLVRLAC